MEYIMAHLKGRRDGLSVRSLRLYVISVRHLQIYKELTDDNGREVESERWKDANSMELPVDQRGIAKSLLENGGAARCVAFLTERTRAYYSPEVFLHKM